MMSDVTRQCPCGRTRRVEPGRIAFCDGCGRAVYQEPVGYFARREAKQRSAKASRPSPAPSRAGGPQPFLPLLVGFLVLRACASGIGPPSRPPRRQPVLPPDWNRVEGPETRIVPSMPPPVEQVRSMREALWRSASDVDQRATPWMSQAILRVLLSDEGREIETRPLLFERDESGGPPTARVVHRSPLRLYLAFAGPLEIHLTRGPAEGWPPISLEPGRYRVFAWTADPDDPIAATEIEAAEGRRVVLRP